MTWRQVALAAVASQRKHFITIDDDASYKRCRVQTDARGVVLRDIVPGSEIKTKKQQPCRAGDFLIAEIDAKAGGYGLVPDDLEGAVVSSHYFLFEIDKNAVDPAYLAWFAKTDAFFQQVRAVGSTNYAAVRPASILQYIIPLPSLAEQQRIVARLDAASEAVARVRELHSAIIEDLESLIVRANEALGSDPVQLRNALTLDEDRVVIAPDATYAQVGIRGFGGGLFRKGSLSVGETTYKHFNQLSNGQFVVSQVKGWEGAVAVCDDDHAGLFASPEYRTFRCDPATLRSTYLAYLCRTRWFHAKLAPATRGQGARRERLRPEMLLAISLPLPPVSVQEKLERVFARISDVKATVSASDLKRLLPSMLNQVFGNAEARD